MPTPFAHAVLGFAATGVAAATHATTQVERAQVEEAPLAERVNEAIARGVALLRARQTADGRWAEAEDAHPGGMTALCALTLIKSGVRRTDDSVQRALKSILATEFKSTYAHSVRLMLFDALALPNEWREHGRKSLEALVATQQGGVWAYPSGAADLSNTQFALLGLRAAHRMGLEVPEGTTLAAIKALGRWQERESGGFQYDEGKPPTASVTAASLGGLVVLDELSKGRSACEAVLRKSDGDRKRALAWLVERFDVARNAWGCDAWTPSFHYPYLWAIERYAGLSGQERIGAHDWYTEGALWLVGAQENDGSWGKTEDTCFALLFLRRATVSTGGAPPEEALAALSKPAPIRPAPDLAWASDVLAAGPWTASEFGALLVAPPFDLSRVRAKEGDKVARKPWRRVALQPRGWSNFDELLGAPCDRGVFAVAAQLDWSGDAPVAVRLWFDLEDGWDIYLDGARISHGRRVQAAIDASLDVEVELAPGSHSLVCLVEDALGAAAFGLRVSDPQGRELERAPTIHSGVVSNRKR
jgi:hypothetical protein